MATATSKNPQRSRLLRLCMAGLAGAVIMALILLAPGCATPVTFGALPVTTPQAPVFIPERNQFIARDGAALGLTAWESETGNPEIVIVAVHGMNEYAEMFYLAAPYWAQRGATVYAYDQRGFGRSPGRGLWPDEELMREDLRGAVDAARSLHPDAEITVVGVSMGGAVALSAFASDNPPAADKLILSGPGLRGWGAMNPLYRASLWMSARTRPGWVVVPPRRFVTIRPTDNEEMLRHIWADPLRLKDNRIDQVHGVVSLMESAHKRAPNLPASLPVLISYGAKDIVIPEDAVKRTTPRLPDHVRTVYYTNGYHMLLRDLQAETVYEDYLAFMRDDTAALPSGETEWPWRQSRQEYAQKQALPIAPGAEAH